MSWKLVPPRPPKTHFYYVRGKYVGIRLDHSTGTSEGDAAARILKTWQRQAERGEFKPPAKRQPKAEAQFGPLTFGRAAVAYMRAGGDGTYMELILKKWGQKPFSEIDQIAVDTLAADLYPGTTAATRNRQVYTPITAVAKRAKVRLDLERPVGWQGKKSTSWLEPDQAGALFKAADRAEPEFGLLCRFLVYTGMRLNEALSRELRHLKLDRSFIYLDDSKNGEPRGCHLPPRLVKALRTQPPRPFRDDAQLTAVVKGVKGFVKGGKGVGRHLIDAGVPFLERKPDAKLFRFHDGGALRDMLKEAMRAAGLSFPRRQGGFHIFCHTYGSWMHRFGGLDTYGLTRTGRWADAESADRYVHTGASEEARRSDLLPVPEGGGDEDTPNLKVVGE